MVAKTYYVTEKAGRYVAGKKLAKDQKTIKLTEREARYELDLGTLSETDPAAGTTTVEEAVAEVAVPKTKRSA